MDSLLLSLSAVLWEELLLVLSDLLLSEEDADVLPEEVWKEYQTADSGSYHSEGGEHSKVPKKF